MDELFFRDRQDAGRRLATALRSYKNDPSVVVLGLPRGGVPVAFEVASALHAPLDVFVVRKLGVPGHREVAMGAIASGGVRVLNQELVQMLQISPMMIHAVATQELIELERQEVAFRGRSSERDFSGRTVILVDDGLATGATMLAAVAALRQFRPARIVVAVPVGSYQACQLLEGDADEVVCLSTPEPFRAVGLWYEAFEQTPDEEVRYLLEAAGAATSQPSPANTQ